MSIVSTEHLLTVPEAAALLGVTEARVRQLCNKGRLGRKFGNQWAISRDELRQFALIPRNPGRPRSSATAAE